MSYEDKKTMWSKLKLERVNGPIVGNCRGIVLKYKSSNNNNVLDSNKEVDFNKKKRLGEDAKRLGIFFGKPIWIGRGCKAILLGIISVLS